METNRKELAPLRASGCNSPLVLTHSTGGWLVPLPDKEDESTAALFEVHLYILHVFVAVWVFFLHKYLIPLFSGLESWSKQDVRALWVQILQLTKTKDGGFALRFALLTCCFNLGLNNMKSKAVSLLVAFQIKGIMFPHNCL